MKITLSKSQWEQAGREAGWIKESQTQNVVNDLRKLHEEIGNALRIVQQKYKEGSVPSYPQNLGFAGELAIKARHLLKSLASVNPKSYLLTADYYNFWGKLIEDHTVTKDGLDYVTDSANNLLLKVQEEISRLEKGETQI